MQPIPIYCQQPYTFHAYHINCSYILSYNFGKQKWTIEKPVFKIVHLHMYGAIYQCVWYNIITFNVINNGFILHTSFWKKWIISIIK